MLLAPILITAANWFGCGLGLVGAAVWRGGGGGGGGRGRGGGPRGSAANSRGGAPMCIAFSRSHICYAPPCSTYYCSDLLAKMCALLGNIAPANSVNYASVCFSSPIGAMIRIVFFDYSLALIG